MQKADLLKNYSSKKTVTTSGKATNNPLQLIAKLNTFNPDSIVQRKPVTKEQAGNAYDSSGSEKWREFIDEKDHEAAIQEAKEGKIKTPGEYYDFHRSGDERIKKFDSFHDFIQADHFVKSRIGKKITAAEYVHIHDLAFQPVSDNLKGLREKDVTWGLPKTATPEQLQNIRNKDLLVNKTDEGHKVTAPLPKGGIAPELNRLFDEYHKGQAEAQTPVEKFENIIELYQKLETLHAFKDGTSRTNHLLLNKLLSEHGLGPAILQEPNSPMFNQKDFGAEVVKGIVKHRNLVKEQKDGSQQDLGMLRKKHLPEELDKLTLDVYKKMNITPPKGMPVYKPNVKDDTDEKNEAIDLRSLQRYYNNPYTLQMPLLDYTLLKKVMGTKKADEINTLYGDQAKRKRDKQNDYDQ